MLFEVTNNKAKIKNQKQFEIFQKRKKKKIFDQQGLRVLPLLRTDVKNCSSFVHCRPKNIFYIIKILYYYYYIIILKCI